MCKKIIVETLLYCTETEFAYFTYADPILSSRLFRLNSFIPSARLCMVMNLPRLVTDLLTPKIIWYQTDLTVVMRIMLADVKDYYLRVESNLLLFSTILQGKEYYVCLYLFGTVVAEETTHKNLGREIKIYLTKAFKWGKWLRLHIENVRNPSIVSDPDHLYQVDWNTEPFTLGVPEWEDFEEYKRKNNITNIMPDVPSTDEEESEDEMFDSWFMK